MTHSEKGVKVQQQERKKMLKMYENFVSESLKYSKGWVELLNTKLPKMVILLELEVEGC